MATPFSRAARERALRSLGVYNYRLYFVGQSISVSGTWMQRVAQDWLVLELTGSAVAIGIASALQFGPMLVFGLTGGVMADRFDRRRALLFTQAAQLLLAAFLAAVTLTGVVELWMIYGFALGLGFVTVLDHPVRQSAVSDLVGPEHYANAHVLNSAANNLGKFIGPAVAAGVIAWWGVGAAFTVNAFSFLPLIVNLRRMNLAALQPRERLPRGRGQALEGLRYVWERQELRTVMWLVLVVSVLGQNFRVVFPILATEVFDGQAAAYGLLMAMLGLGAVVAAVATAARETATVQRLMVTTVSFGAACLLLAASPRLWFAAAVAVGIGVANFGFNTLGRTVLQLSSDRSVHGRVLALHGLIFLGSHPIGGPLLGWVCEIWGARAGLLLSGGSALLAALVATRMATPRPDPGPAPDPFLEEAA